VEAQTGRSHTTTSDPQVQTRQWVTWVRDPIDHFLSGFAECGYRQLENLNDDMGNLTKTWEKLLKVPYNSGVRRFLRKTMDLSKQQRSYECEIHGFPQANSLLFKNGTIDNHVVVLGDMREMEGVLELVNFQYNSTIKKGRDSSQNEVSQTLPPSFE
jgi:hypothetical protein